MDVLLALCVSWVMIKSQHPLTKSLGRPFVRRSLLDETGRRDEKMKAWHKYYSLLFAKLKQAV